MDLSTYTAEDFVLDPAFRKWVLNPNRESNLMWEKLLVLYPSKHKEAKRAREIIISLSKKHPQKLSDSELWELWEIIESDLTVKNTLSKEEKTIPLHAISTLQRPASKSGYKGRFFSPFILRVACILALMIGFGFLGSYFLSEPVSEKLPIAVFKEHITAPGVKALITLSDGSEVILNSGSKINYVKNFEKDQRVVFLEGEAFFTVAKDNLRPFSVITGKVKTTALGTIFNVKSYEPSSLDISLLNGKVAVERSINDSLPFILTPGEALNIDISCNQFEKKLFDEEIVTGWTKKSLIFRQTPLPEAVRTLENWYGVTFDIRHAPHYQVLFSGKFQNETLRNVLEGLSYAANFDFEINKDKVKIIFKE